MEKALSINDKSPLSSDEDDEAPLVFTHECKRPRLQTDLTKCIICQSKIKDKTFQASEKGFQSFQSAANIRKDGVYERLQLEVGTSEADFSTVI